jgi:hypothetical protein
MMTIQLLCLEIPLGGTLYQLKTDLRSSRVRPGDEKTVFVLDCLLTHDRCMIIRYLTGFLRKHGRISKGALERSSSTDSRKMININVSTEYLYCNQLYYSFQKTSRIDYVILTLDPKKFAEKKRQCLRIGDQKTFHSYVMLQNQSYLNILNAVVSPQLHYYAKVGHMHDPTMSREIKNFNGTLKTTKIKISAAPVDREKNSS